MLQKIQIPSQRTLKLLGFRIFHADHNRNSIYTTSGYGKHNKQRLMCTGLSQRVQRLKHCGLSSPTKLSTSTPADLETLQKELQEKEKRIQEFEKKRLTKNSF